MQLLWINLMSDIFPGLALAIEPPEPDVLSRPPRDPGEPIIKRSDFKRITFESGVLTAGSLGAFAYGASRYGLGARANSMAFLSLTIGQLVHSLSCRSDHLSVFSEEKPPHNPHLTLALGGSFALQALAMAFPWTRSILGITSISALDGLVIGGGALIPFVVNEATKNSEKGAER
jgi:Ca2+-transporting ATPase